MYLSHIEITVDCYPVTIYICYTYDLRIIRTLIAYIRSTDRVYGQWLNSVILKLVDKSL